MTEDDQRAEAKRTKLKSTTETKNCWSLRGRKGATCQPVSTQQRKARTMRSRYLWLKTWGKQPESRQPAWRPRRPTPNIDGRAVSKLYTVIKLLAGVCNIRFKENVRSRMERRQRKVSKQSNKNCQQRASWALTLIKFCQKYAEHVGAFVKLLGSEMLPLVLLHSASFSSYNAAHGRRAHVHSYTCTSTYIYLRAQTGKALDVGTKYVHIYNNNNSVLTTQEKWAQTAHNFSIFIALCILTHRWAQIKSIWNKFQMYSKFQWQDNGTRKWLEKIMACQHVCWQ